MLLWRASMLRVSGRRKATTARPPRPISAMAQKMTRQLKNSVNVLPASGARIGETLKTSIVVAIRRAASWPVCRSRMIARVITMLAQAPTPWTKRRAISASALGREAAPDAADDEQRQPEIDRRFAADAIGNRPVEDLAERDRREKSSSGSSAPRRYPPTDRGRWPGRPADTCRSRTARWPRAFRERWRCAERRIS